MDTSEIEYFMFKKVQNRYVFRAPAIWLFGTGRHYLVNEAQKAVIVEILKLKQPNRSIVMGLVLSATIVIVVMAWAYFYRDHEPGIAGYLLMMVMVLASIFAFAQVFAWVQLYRLKPVLAHLQRSEERISHSELRAAMLRDEQEIENTPET